jgi:hypothetical protein
MARTFQDLTTEALASDFDASSFPGSRAGQYVNEAVYRVARKVRIPTLEATQSITTTAGTASFSLPADDIRVLELFNATDRNALGEVTQQQIDEQPVTSGKPEFWARFGGNVALYPTPDQAYSLSLRYVKRTVFANTSDTTGQVGFPDDYADLLVSWARHRMFRFEDDQEMATYWLGEFSRQLAELQMDMGRQSERVRQLPSMFDYGDTGPTFVRP